MSKIVRFISSDGQLCATAIDSTEIVAKVEEYFQPSAVITAALGRLVTAASLMGDQLKGENDTITLRVRGDGPSGELCAVADSCGNVRGCVQNSIVEIPLKPNGKLDVSGAVGHGMLFVTKDLGMKEPYNGAVELISGEIAEDIAAYYAQSEQIPTVCALGVLVNPDLSVRAAGGYLIQLLPFATDEVITRLEKAIERIQPVTAMIDEGTSAEDMIKSVLCDFEMELLDTRECAYKCNCSREKTIRVLKSIGKEELEKLADEQATTEVNCKFCNSKYVFTSEELRAIFHT